PLESHLGYIFIAFGLICVVWDGVNPFLRGKMGRINFRSLFSVGLILAVFVLAFSAPAQVTTGNVTGRVVDSTGSVIPGAHVALISEVHGTRSATITSNNSGDYVFPDVTPDAY